MKLNRTEIYKKYDGRCGYCGNKISHDNMKLTKIDKTMLLTTKNARPACPRCVYHIRFSGMGSVEMLRKAIAREANRLRDECAGYRLAEDYGQVRETGNPVQFWFEREHL